MSSRFFPIPPERIEEILRAGRAMSANPDGLVPYPVLPCDPGIQTLQIYEVRVLGFLRIFFHEGEIFFHGIVPASGNSIAARSYGRAYGHFQIVRADAKRSVHYGYNLFKNSLRSPEPTGMNCGNQSCVLIGNQYGTTVGGFDSDANPFSGSYQSIGLRGINFPQIITFPDRQKSATVSLPRP